MLLAAFEGGTFMVEHSGVGCISYASSLIIRLALNEVFELKGKNPT